MNANANVNGAIPGTQMFVQHATAFMQQLSAWVPLQAQNGISNCWLQPQRTGCINRVCYSVSTAFELHPVGRMHFSCPCLNQPARRLVQKKCELDGECGQLLIIGQSTTKRELAFRLLWRSSSLKASFNITTLRGYIFNTKIHKLKYLSKSSYRLWISICSSI